MIVLKSLAEVFAQVRDPWQRHPGPGILTLVFLGLLARIRDMAVLGLWASVLWKQLRELKFILNA